MSWEKIAGKFRKLAASCASPDLLDAIVHAVADLGKIRVRELTVLLGKMRHQTV
jgi:hypothetical protein